MVGASADLGRQLARWAEDIVEALKDSDPDIPDELHDRAADNWSSFSAITDAAGLGVAPKGARGGATLLEVARIERQRCDFLGTSGVCSTRWKPTGGRQAPLGTTCAR